MSKNTSGSNEVSPSSDEKMDTGSDPALSHSHSPGTPHSTSDCDDPDARHNQILQPCDSYSNGSGSEHVHRNTNTNPDLQHMKHTSRTGISPPRHSSTLTTTTHHPLMGLVPDLIPKKLDEPESLSSVDEDKYYPLYHPQRNTSKNNLYLTECVTSVQTLSLTDSYTQPESLTRAGERPDVTRVRRKIVPQLDETPPQATLGRNLLGGKVDSAVRVPGHSTPKADESREEYHSALEWAGSPLQRRSAPVFQLPIEMCAALRTVSPPPSPPPPARSPSPPSEQSSLQACLDPYSGRVALHHVTRRKIQLPVEEDGSLDSLSDGSLDSEGEEGGLGGPATPPSDDDHTKRSLSSHTASRASSIPEYSLAEEMSRERTWRSVPSQRRVCDMKVIEPYKRVLSHGGYAGGLALVVFSACHLPDNSRADYTYVMDNLFLYVVWSLERLVTEQYAVVYLHGGARRRLPALSWTHAAYRLLDCRLRKSLKHLYLVHPTFWLKSFVLLTKPFVSSKFFKKLSYIKSLDELLEKVPVEPNAIPDRVWEYDRQRHA